MLLSRLAACAGVAFALAFGAAPHAAVAGQWKMCAIEGNDCTVPPNTNVRYGHSRFAYNSKVMSGEFQCENKVFGDPLPGALKNCFYLKDPRLPETAFEENTESGVDGMQFELMKLYIAGNLADRGINVPPEQIVLCAREFRKCKVPPNTEVYYGFAKWRYRSKTMSGTFKCANSEFGDAAYGDKKQCDYWVE